MNLTRVALAAVAGTVADFVYGFVVYGNLLTSSFLAQGSIYRAAEAQMANVPLGAVGLLVAMVAAAVIFAKSQWRGVAGGVTYGLLLAIFAIGTCVVVNYATLNMSGDHAVKMILAALGEWVLVGAAIGAVYRGG